MDEDDYRAALLAAGLQDVGNLVESPSWAKEGFGMEGTMLVAGERLRVGVSLPKDFPSGLPKVYVLSALTRRLPHVEANKHVCAMRAEGTFHDTRRDADLVTEILDGARRVIEDGLLGRNSEDFLVEAEAYWAGEPVKGVVDANGEARTISVAYTGTGELVAVADTRAEAEKLFPDLRGRWRDGLYLPLDPARTKAAHPERFAEWPGRLVEELTPDAAALLQSRQVSGGKKFVVILGVPRPHGGRALLGVILSKFQHEAALPRARPRRVECVTIERYDAERLLERAPASRPNRIAVVGCGAVGGHVAHALAWAGVRELVLVDPDLHTGGNTYRHALGRLGWNKVKVAALKAQLEAAMPDLKVTPLAMTVDAAFASHGDVLTQSDAVVIAIGNPSVPLQLNDELAERAFGAPVVFTWLEPYGIGGHAALVRYGSKGCFRCLFRDEAELHNTADFAAPGQRFARQELGCHGAFTPYGDLDARETALLAARTTLVAVHARGSPAALRSWRGNATSFHSAGYRTSPRFEEFDSRQQAVLSPRPECTCCGQR